MSTERFGGSVLINGVPIAMSDEEVDRLLRTGRMCPRSDLSKLRDDLTTELVDRFGFALEVPVKGLNGKRRFRWEAARIDPETGFKVAVEYQGFGSGAAHRFRGRQAGDHEKLNEAQLCGWVVVQCDAVSAKSGKCMHYVEEALRGAGVS